MGSKKQPDEPQASQTASWLAQQYWSQTDPLRKGIIKRGKDFLGVTDGPASPGGGGGGGGVSGMLSNFLGDLPPTGSYEYGPSRFDPTASAMYDPMKQAIESSYQGARENILANTPEGGALFDSLARAEMARASELSGAAGQIAQDEYNKIYGLASGSPQTTFSTLANVGGQQALANAQSQAGKLDMFGDLGMGTGLILAGK